MTRWITDEEVAAAQETGDFSALEKLAMPFAMSPDRIYCVLVREHAAWKVENGEWRSGNFPPDEGEPGRATLNFFKKPEDDEPRIWFKTLVPLGCRIERIDDDGAEALLVVSDSEKYRLSYRRIDGVAWELLTGFSQSEDEITAAFAKIWDDC